jgi:hypothetical protein
VISPLQTGFKYPPVHCILTNFSTNSIHRLLGAKETTKNSNFGVKGFAEALEPIKGEKRKCN